MDIAYAPVLNKGIVNDKKHSQNKIVAINIIGSTLVKQPVSVHTTLCTVNACAYYCSLNHAGGSQDFFEGGSELKWNALRGRPGCFS